MEAYKTNEKTEAFQELDWNDVSRYFLMQFMITSKCNLKCKHCYEDETVRKDVRLDEQKIILGRYFDAMHAWNRIPTLALSGGEPLVSENFWPLMDFIQERYETEKCGSFEILTNGTLITSSVAQKLKRYSNLTLVQVSLDGATPEVHDGVRGKGAFKKATQALVNLNDANVPTAVHYVVHRNNYGDAFKITDIAVKFKVSQLLVTRLVPLGRGKDMQTLMLSPEETRKLYLKLSDDTDRLLTDYTKNKTGTLIVRNRCDWPVIFHEIENYKKNALFTKNGSRCQAGLIHIAVMQDGTVYPCRRMPIRIGNLLNQEFSEVWKNEFLWKLRLKDRLMQGKCKSCAFNKDPAMNYSCSGGASCVSYGFYGDPFKPDPQCSYDPPEKV